MRLILFFFIGFFSSFYLGEIFNRFFKKPVHGLIGLVILVTGILIAFFGKYYFFPPLDAFIATTTIGAGLGLSLHQLLSWRYLISEDVESRLVQKHDTRLERFLEILPGALMWIALTSPIWLSLTLPYALAYLIILADIYWLFTAVKTAILIYAGYRKFSFAARQPWLKLLEKDFPDNYKDYYHLMLIPVYKENLDVLAPTFDAIVNSNFPKDKIFLAVGFEERTGEEKIDEIKKHLKQYEGKIAAVFTSIHPFGLPGELPGAGTNRNWMVLESVKELKKRGITPKQVIATTLDADFVVHKEFLAGMAHKYLSTPQDYRNKRSFTGVFLYYNNYWQAPTPMRLIATGTAFWQISEMVGSDKYQNFSSMSINLQSILDIGLWIPNKVNDDSGFYWKAYFHFNGDYKVIPHYLPISADAVLDVNIWRTFQNQYLQLKRWAYGVEHIPFVVKEYFKRKDIDFWDKTDKLLFVLWGNFRWGFLALFVTFAGSLIQVVNPQYSQSVLSINLPIVSSWVLTAAFFGLFATIYVHEKTAPPRPQNWGFVTRLWSYIQWLLIPLIIISISTFPAIDAQTSLMFGKYMKEFRTTNKARIPTE